MMSREIVMVKLEPRATHFSCTRNLQLALHAFVLGRFFGARVILHHIPEAHHLIQLEAPHGLNLGKSR